MPEQVKVAIVGPESTGKTSLSKALAEHFQTLYVPEFAREYLEQQDRPYTEKDVEHIAGEQIRLEDQLAEKVENVLICDTNLVVIKIWMEHAYGKCPQWILEEIHRRNYDLTLLTGIDFPWEPDPLREHPDLREYFYKIYKTTLEDHKINFIEISGSKVVRLQKAITAIQSLLKGHH